MRYPDGGGLTVQASVFRRWRASDRHAAIGDPPAVVAFVNAPWGYLLAVRPPLREPRELAMPD
jgi:hypothetical protein